MAVLSGQHNLADGHSYRPWTTPELAVIGQATQIMKGVDRRDQREIERSYLRDFHGLAGQTFDEAAFDHFLCFTASSALEAIANYIRLNGLSVGLIEPCFDNLADIVRRHGIAMTPIPEAVLDCDSDPTDALRPLDVDVVFLVTPNNPTGRAITPKNLQLIADYCAAEGKLLILDTCFRFYLPRAAQFDQYRLLAESRAMCVLVEDTGKTWPTLELKAPFFAVSRSVADAFGHIYSDFLLHVSPFTVRLVHEFVRLSCSDGLRAVTDPVAINRSELCRALSGSGFVAEAATFMSTAWTRLPDPLESTDAVALFADRGVHVLPGDHFFWSRPDLGRSFVRVALARDPVMFREAADRMASAVNAHAPW